MPAGPLATTHSSSLWKTASSATGVAGASKAARSSPPLSHLPNLHLQNVKFANLWERSDVFASFSRGSHRFAPSRQRARPRVPGLFQSPIIYESAASVNDEIEPEIGAG